MIVRDEEEQLPGCLSSIRDIVDEIVVVDTGSRDRTVEIAEKFGARVHTHDWRGDFARARNAGLERTRGAWVLSVDADERLRPISRPTVRRALLNAREVALRVRLEPFPGATPYWESRLWRSDPRIRFAGQLHERVGTAIDAVAAADRLTIGESELYLEHVVDEGSLARKRERYLPLLKAQLARDPRNVYDWNHLALVLDGLGRREASTGALERAVEAARSAGGSAGGLVFAELVRRRREHDGGGSHALLEEGLARYPDSIALAWQKVCAEVDAQRYTGALRWLEHFEADRDMPVEDAVAYPAELIFGRVAEARGLCLFRQGRFTEAADAYGQAETFEPDVLSHRAKRVVARRRAIESGDSDQAASPAAGWGPRDVLRGASVDLAGVSVGLWATDAVRARAIHEMLGCMERSDSEPEAELRFVRYPLPLPAREANETQGALRLWHDEHTAVSALGTWVSGRAEEGKGVIGGDLPSLAGAFRSLAPFVLADLLANRGRFLLHAGAVEREGRGVLVLGDSGAGKSSFVFAAQQAGWSVLSDDLVIMRAGQAGPMMSGVFKGLVVPTELAVDSKAVATAGDQRNRVRLPFTAWRRGWSGVSGVVLVGHGGRPCSGVEEPLARHVQLSLLLRAMLSRRPNAVRTYFDTAVKLSEIRGRRLLLPELAEYRLREAAGALETWSR